MIPWLRSSGVEQQTHKLLVGGSNPPAATRKDLLTRLVSPFCFLFNDNKSFSLYLFWVSYGIVTVVRNLGTEAGQSQSALSRAPLRMENLLKGDID